MHEGQVAVLKHSARMLLKRGATRQASMDFPSLRVDCGKCEGDLQASLQPLKLGHTPSVSASNFSLVGQSAYHCT